MDNGSDDQYHRYFSTQPTYDSSKSEDNFKDYGYSHAHHLDHYYDDGRTQPDATQHSYYKVPVNHEAETTNKKFIGHQEKYSSGGNSNNEDFQSDSFPKTASNYMANKPHRPSYSMYNDEHSMIHPDSAVHLLKNIAQPSEYPQSNMNEQQTNSGDQDMQNLLSQFSSSNLAIKPNEQNVPSLSQEFSNSNMNDFVPFSENLASSSPISDINGIAGFQPAPEGGQLPAPPGYKHVGYITIPAGAANLPNMVSQPNNGLPLIRPIPINSVDLSKLNKNKDSKKGHDNKGSDTKPVRSFLSRLNPLNMLKRLRQRRERRQTNDISSNDYLPLSNKYSSNYGYNGLTNSYSLPYGYNSLSGLGGMSGLNGMYTSSSMYAPSYASYSFGGYSGYPGYGYMSPVVSPYQSASITDMKAATNGASGDMNVAASAVSPQASTSPHMPMTMPMMMPMPVAGYGYPGMSSMPMSSMPMTGYVYPGHSHPHIPSASSSGSSSSGSSSTNEQTNPLANQNLPGGINLADLLKDEEDEEPSRFRKFLGYLNPMNIIKRFRNNTSEERKRLGRYKRDLQLYLVNGKKASQIQKRIDEAKKESMSNNSLRSALDIEPTNSTSELVKVVDSEPIDEMDEILAHDSVPKVIHGRRKSPKKVKYNLMGSRNFEIIRGGTFQTEDIAPLRSSESNEYDQTTTNVNGGNILTDSEDEIFDNESPEILGFQGFNGFSSMYNSLSASNQSPNFAEPSMNTSESKVSREEQKVFQSIEHAAITNSELKAIS